MCKYFFYKDQDYLCSLVKDHLRIEEKRQFDKNCNTDNIQQTGSYIKECSTYSIRVITFTLYF